MMLKDYFTAKQIKNEAIKAIWLQYDTCDALSFLLLIGKQPPYTNSAMLQLDPVVVGEIICAEEHEIADLTSPALDQSIFS